MRCGETEESLRVRIWAGILVALCFGALGQAQTWERLGPDGGLVVSLGASAGKTLYLGTADGHVFVRDRNAKTWELCGRVGTRTDAVVTRILADPRDERVAYAAVWYQNPQAGGGVFRSEDAGKNWKLTGLAGEAVRALEMAPSEPDEFIAGTRTGVFRSRDRGKNWERISPEGDEELRNLDSVAIDSKDANTIYAGTYHLPWKTTDGGKTWKRVVAGLIDDSDIMSLRVDATDPARVYLSACSGIYRSENRGEQWTKLQGIPYAARRTQAIVQDPGKPQTLYAATTEGLWVTRDGGESWERSTPKEWVVNSVVLANDAGKTSRVMIGTEAQGVLVSADEGKNFTTENEGFTHRVVKELESGWNEPRHLAMILERDRQEILESQNGGESWSPLKFASANGTNSAYGKKTASLSPENVAQVYGTLWGWMLRTDGGRLWLREDGKESWTEWKLTLPAHEERAGKSKAAVPVGPKALKIVNGPWLAGEKSIWLGTQEGLARCEHGGRCTVLRAFGKSGAVTATLMGSEGAKIYAVAGNKFGVSADGGNTATWRDLPNDVQAVKWIANAETAGTVFLGTDHGLYASSDDGSNWQRRQNGLPAGQIDQKYQDEYLFVITLADGGMYISQDDGMTWKRVDEDAERGHFTGLAAAGGMLVAGSQSEGILRALVKRHR
jgi:photosystem II stability/assembly factor-like uncharacterized protein